MIYPHPSPWGGEGIIYQILIGTPIFKHAFFSAQKMSILFETFFEFAIDSTVIARH